MREPGWIRRGPWFALILLLAAWMPLLLWTLYDDALDWWVTHRIGTGEIA